MDQQVAIMEGTQPCIGYLKWVTIGPPYSRMHMHLQENVNYSKRLLGKKKTSISFANNRSRKTFSSTESKVDLPDISYHPCCLAVRPRCGRFKQGFLAQPQSNSGSEPCAVTEFQLVAPWSSGFKRVLTHCPPPADSALALWGELPAYQGLINHLLTQLT